MIERKVYKLKTEDVQDDGIVTGYASTGKKDVDGDVVEPSAFNKTIQEGGTWPFLFMHDVKRPIGLITGLEYDGKGIRFTAEIDLDVDDGQRVFSGIKKGYIDRTSIGFKAIKHRYDKATKTRHIEELRLYELSAVTKNFSANDEALVTGYKTENLIDIIEAIQNLKADQVTQEQLEASITHLQTLLKATEPVNATLPEQPSTDTIAELAQLVKRLKEAL